MAASKQPTILVVGAGPVGLTAAVELTRRGFEPRVIDQGEGPAIESRALAVNPRSLEILEPSGASARMLAKGLKIARLNFWEWPRLVFTVPVSRLDHRFNFILALPQDDTERVLIDRLEEMGGAVEWGSALTGLDASPGGARATIERGGRTETLEADILIGADGAHSRVRKALGIGFSGDTDDEDFGLADAILSGPVHEDEVNVFRVEQGIFAMIPAGHGRFRLVTDQPDVLSAVPERYVVEKVAWQSRFRISYRQVETYQKGSVFLAGDAAHIHSPVGGRGMNLGIEDAATLAWLIETGRTQEYTQRRRPVGAHVLRQTDAQTRLMTSRGVFATFLRRWVAPFLLERDFVLKRLLPEMAGLAAAPPEWL